LRPSGNGANPWPNPCVFLPMLGWPPRRVLGRPACDAQRSPAGQTKDTECVRVRARVERSIRCLLRQLAPQERCCSLRLWMGATASVAGDVWAGEAVLVAASAASSPTTSSCAEAPSGVGTAEPTLAQWLALRSLPLAKRRNLPPSGSRRAGRRSRRLPNHLIGSCKSPACARASRRDRGCRWWDRRTIGRGGRRGSEKAVARGAHAFGGELPGCRRWVGIRRRKGRAVVMVPGRSP
jgi:hypothetical protein